MGATGDSDHTDVTHESSERSESDADADPDSTEGHRPLSNPQDEP